MATFISRPSASQTAFPAGAIPHNIEAEMALLGALLINNKAYERIVDILDPAAFANLAHRRIFEAIKSLLDQGRVADPINLKSYFEDEDKLAEEAVGPDYLAEITTGAVLVPDVTELARLIQDLHVRRVLIDVGMGLAGEARHVTPDEDAYKVLERTEEKLFGLAEHGQAERGFISLQQASAAAVASGRAARARNSHVTGVTTGFRTLDKQLGGLHSSDLIILAGRPSMGKSAMAVDIAFRAAERKLKDPEEGAVVAIFSLEMSAEQLGARLLAEYSGIKSDSVRRGDVSKEELDRFAAAGDRLARAPLFIDDTPSLTVVALRNRARRLKRREGLDLIIIDYLQLMNSEGQGRDNRVWEVSEISRGLKSVAKDLEVPVLALSQLSRAVETREDKRPQLSDLRESGAIEQDADVVMFLYRQEYYESRAEPEQRSDETEEKYKARHAAWLDRWEEVRNKAEIYIAKQRHGPIGKLQLFFDPQLTRFDDYVEESIINPDSASSVSSPLASTPPDREMAGKLRNQKFDDVPF